MPTPKEDAEYQGDKMEDVHSASCMRAAAKLIGRELSSADRFVRDVIEYLTARGEIDIIPRCGEPDAWCVEFKPRSGDRVFSGGSSLPEALCGVIHTILPPLPKPATIDWSKRLRTAAGGNIQATLIQTASGGPELQRCVKLSFNDWSYDVWYTEEGKLVGDPGHPFDLCNVEDTED